MAITSVSNPAPLMHAPAGPNPAVPPNEQQRSLIRAVSAVNTAQMFGSDNEVTYQMDRKANQMVLRVVNRKSGRLVNEIPPGYVLRLAEEIKGRASATG
jgi:uncharacterized FlaG/YvyC family protein